jgi:hypothetical protein
MRDSIIHIPTYSSSHEIKSLVVIFIHLHLTFCRVVERHWDHVHLLYDLLDGTSQTQKIVASLVLPVTKILAIEDHKLHYTFLHVAFMSQSLLRLTSDQTSCVTN